MPPYPTALPREHPQTNCPIRRNWSLNARKSTRPIIGRVRRHIGVAELVFVLVLVLEHVLIFVIELNR